MKADREKPAQPLSGWRVVVTRAEGRGDGLATLLRDAGAEPILYPTITYGPPETYEFLDHALEKLAAGSYDWLLLTSATSVSAINNRQHQRGLAASQIVPATCQLAAVGPATAAACMALLEVQPAVVPERFVAEGLASALGDLRGQRVLLLNADIARPALAELLRAAGAVVERVVAYRTLPASGGVDLPPLLAAGAVGAITFTSGSTVNHFVDRIGPKALVYARRSVIACIGPVTADAARAATLPPTIVAPRATAEGLVDALIDYVMRE